MEGLSKLFKGSEKVTFQRFESRYEMNLQNCILMDIKIIIAEILLIVNRISLDLRITSFMKEFKKEYNSIDNNFLFKKKKKSSSKIIAESPLKHLFFSLKKYINYSQFNYFFSGYI